MSDPASSDDTIGADEPTIRRQLADVQRLGREGTAVALPHLAELALTSRRALRVEGGYSDRWYRVHSLAASALGQVWRRSGPRVEGLALLAGYLDWAIARCEVERDRIADLAAAGLTASLPAPETIRAWRMLAVGERHLEAADPVIRGRALEVIVAAGGPSDEAWKRIAVNDGLLPYNMSLERWRALRDLWRDRVPPRTVPAPVPPASLPADVAVSDDVSIPELLQRLRRTGRRDGMRQAIFRRLLELRFDARHVIDAMIDEEADSLSGTMGLALWRDAFDAMVSTDAAGAAPAPTNGGGTIVPRVPGQDEELD